MPKQALKMNGLKSFSIVCVVLTLCLGLSHGDPIPEENFEVAAASGPLQLSDPSQATPLLMILRELGPQGASYQERLTSLTKTIRELFDQLSGFAPYVAKIFNPIVKAISQAIERGTTYVMDYIRNLPPETVKEIQMKIMELLRKLMNMNFVRTLVRLVIQAMI